MVEASFYVAAPLPRGVSTSHGLAIAVHSVGCAVLSLLPLESKGLAIWNAPK